MIWRRQGFCIAVGRYLHHGLLCVMVIVGTCDIRYLVRAFTKSWLGLCGVFAHSAHLSSWVMSVISKYKLA